MALEYCEKFDDAESLYRRTLDARGRILGVEHPDTLQTANDLGTLLLHRGKPDLGEPILRHCLDDRRRVLGPDHPKTLETLSNLAVTLQHLNRFDEADPLTRQAADDRRRVLGPDHPDTLISQMNLVSLAYRQGRSAEAEPLLRAILESQKRLLGPEHPTTLISLNNLAMLLFGQEKLLESEALFLEAMEGSRRALGSDYIATVDTEFSVVMVMLDLGHWQRALPLARDLVARRRRIMPAGDRQVAYALQALGWALVETGSPDEAEALLREAREIERKLTKPGQWVLPQIESLIGSCMAAQGHYALAEPLLTESQPTLEMAKGISNARKRAAINRVVRLYEAWNKPAKAAEWRAKLEPKQPALPDNVFARP